MKCKNHPEIDATGRCTGCQESFCANCLLEIHGQQYCGSCKVLAVQSQPSLGAISRPCETASQALKYAIFSIFCFGIILGPIALSKAAAARRELAANPTLTGSGKVTAATIVAIIGIVLWILNIIVMMLEKSGSY